MKLETMMKRLLSIGAILLIFNASPVLAHHPAADIVDEEIYENIDSMVADTPHADLTFDEMGGGMTETTITYDSLSDFESMIARDDLLEYVELLDGVVDVSLAFNPDSTVTLTINQVR
jgi:hypothetical protein